MRFLWPDSLPSGLQLSNQQVNGNVPEKLDLRVCCWDANRNETPRDGVWRAPGPALRCWGLSEPPPGGNGSLPRVPLTIVAGASAPSTCPIASVIHEACLIDAQLGSTLLPLKINKPGPSELAWDFCTAETKIKSALRSRLGEWRLSQVTLDRKCLFSAEATRALCQQELKDTWPPIVPFPESPSGKYLPYTPAWMDMLHKDSLGPALTKNLGHTLSYPNLLYLSPQGSCTSIPGGQLELC